MSESEDSGYHEEGWIQWFCNLEDHHFFCPVDVEYIKDISIYMDLRNYSPITSILKSEALNMIIDPDSPEDEDLEDQRFLDIYQEAMDLYGLIHARFIVSPKGLAIMREKFLNGIFGVCPRVLCSGQYVLPIGISEHLRHSRVKVFCPKCEDVYIPKKKCSDVDGAYFSCSFPHILLQTYPELIPKEKKILYVPRIYGFKIFKKRGSKYEEKDENPVYNTYYEEKVKNKQFIQLRL